MENRLAEALDQLGQTIEAMCRQVHERLPPIPAHQEGEIVSAIERLRGLIAAHAVTPADSQESPCANCPKRESCNQSCERLDRLLPGVYAGRGRREQLCGLEPDLDTRDYRNSATDQYGIFLRCAHLFTPRQWQVIELYYRQGKTEAEISVLLHLSASAVSERLTRAHERIRRRQIRAFPKETE